MQENVNIKRANVMDLENRSFYIPLQRSYSRYKGKKDYKEIVILGMEEVDSFWKEVGAIVDSV